MEFSRISPDVKLGKGVTIHGFVNLYGCSIGNKTKIGAFVEVQKDAEIGDNCKISSHTFICEGVSIGNEVFVGHNVTFINDRYPKSTKLDGSLQTDDDWAVVPTSIEDSVSIGSSATIMCGVTVGKGAVIGAGAVVIRDVPSGEIWAGNPARFLRKVNHR